MTRIAIGVDVGTTGARAVAADEQGRVVAVRSADYPLHTPHPGWTEQDPEDWWRAAREVLAATAQAIDGEIVGLGLTGQMHGSVFLDAAGAVIRPRCCGTISGPPRNATRSPSGSAPSGSSRSRGTLR